MRLLKALFSKKPKAEDINQEEEYETADEVIARTNKMAMQMFNEFEEANKKGEAEELAEKYIERYDLDRPDTSHNSNLTPKGTKVVLPNFVHNSHRFVCVDVETSNQKPSSICQIGLAFVSDAETISTYSLLIDPEDDFNSNNTALHGITKKSVDKAANFADAMSVLREILEPYTLVQHSPFDKRAFDAACVRYGIEAIDTKWVDSIKVAKSAWPEFQSSGGYGLANLTMLLKIDFEHHDAEEDARATAKIVLAAEKTSGKTYDKINTVQRKRVQKAAPLEGDVSGRLHGETACFTGQLNMTRAEASKAAASVGISVKNGVTKKTTMLVVGDQDLDVLAGHPKSLKHRKAEELIEKGQEIKVLSETEFVKLLNAD